MDIVKNYENANGFKAWVTANGLNYTTSKESTFKVYLDLQDMGETEKDDKYAFALLKLVMASNSNVKYKKVKITTGGSGYILDISNDNRVGNNAASTVIGAWNTAGACYVVDRAAQACYVVYLASAVNDVIATLEQEIATAEAAHNAAMGVYEAADTALETAKAQYDEAKADLYDKADTHNSLVRLNKRVIDFIK